MHEGRTLASGIVDLIAATLDAELGRTAVAGKPAKAPKAVDVDAIDTRDVARRITIDLLDHLESRGVLFGRRGPGGPGGHGGPPPPPPPPPGERGPARRR